MKVQIQELILQPTLCNKMFSFHKPKIYRSNSGCCICKAKSSSSRFTDSKKYEAEFERCFRVQEKRTGEICNACVLLVKRWKKLPPGTQRDWRHVVDARAGPGTKLTSPCKGRSSLGKKISKPKKHLTDDVLGMFSLLLLNQTNFLDLMMQLMMPWTF